MPILLSFYQFGWWFSRRPSGRPRHVRRCFATRAASSPTPLNFAGKAAPPGGIGLVRPWAPGKLRNIERDPRVVLSFDAPREPGVFLNPYAVLHARATVESSDHAWDLLDRLTKVYMSPDADFPAPKGPGYLVRYSVGRIGGVGPWVAASR